MQVYGWFHMSCVFTSLLGENKLVDKPYPLARLAPSQVGFLAGFLNHQQVQRVFQTMFPGPVPSMEASETKTKLRQVYRVGPLPSDKLDLKPPKWPYHYMGN